MASHFASLSHSNMVKWALTSNALLRWYRNCVNLNHLSKSVRIDEHLFMKSNARHCAKTRFFHLWRIHQLRHYVDYETLYKMIHALILSRLDYFNSLFACSSQSTLHRLQRVQDAAARLLCGASAQTHAPPLLKQLHWMPVSSRIQFNLRISMFHQSWYCSTILVRSHPTLWQHPA